MVVFFFHCTKDAYVFYICSPFFLISATLPWSSGGPLPRCSITCTPCSFYFSYLSYTLSLALMGRRMMQHVSRPREETSEGNWRCSMFRPEGARR